MNGKGDKRRPMNISRSLYETRFKEIFSAFEFVDKIKKKKKLQSAKKDKK